MLFGKKNKPLIFKWLQAGTGQRINSELSGEMKRQLQMISLEEEDLEILSRLKPIVSKEIETRQQILSKPCDRKLPRRNDQSVQLSGEVKKDADDPYPGNVHRQDR
ncbi:hypothetical protein ABES25_13210 [Bacillus gobiensis]|uniref:hypothetical protein n=1 Tax=Bacillus gobiensis TaxID=1441095 RepID=UPI003D1EBAAF